MLQCFVNSNDAYATHASPNHPLVACPSRSSSAAIEVYSHAPCRNPGRITTGLLLLLRTLPVSADALVA